MRATILFGSSFAGSFAGSFGWWWPPRS